MLEFVFGMSKHSRLLGLRLGPELLLLLGGDENFRKCSLAGGSSSLGCAFARNIGTFKLVTVPK